MAFEVPSARQRKILSRQEGCTLLRGREDLARALPFSPASRKLDEWVLCKVYTPKNAKHSKNGQKSDHPPKERNEQNRDQPNGNSDSAPMTPARINAGKRLLMATCKTFNPCQITSSTRANKSRDQPTGLQCSAISQPYAPQLYGTSYELRVGCGSACIYKFSIWSYSPRASGLLFGSRPAILLPKSHPSRSSWLPAQSTH
ncbi:uncharacterized protein LOC130137770 [Syzygium oleosum]|uniref:uncharacterized protein LOC130137770 n=1 Tax=Syzygium oleosum TaxID=219896 RepID=UPI0024B90ACE|nr:uncharacterized protein LOC130137770 [Syzygium oleosum]